MPHLEVIRRCFKLGLVGLTAFTVVMSSSSGAVGTFTGTTIPVILLVGCSAVRAIHLGFGNLGKGNTEAKIGIGWMWVTVILMNDNSQTLEFQPVTDQNMANQLGLTALEVTAYNQELPQIQLAFEEYKTEVEDQLATNPSLSPDDVRVIWLAQATQVQLSSLAIQAVEKITRQL